MRNKKIYSSSNSLIELAHGRGKVIKWMKGKNFKIHLVIIKHLIIWNKLQKKKLWPSFEIRL
jgi:hypothetical protein